MELPVVIEPLPDRNGFTAHLGAPFDLSAVAATAEEAQRQVVALLQHRLQQGMEIRTIRVPPAASAGRLGGWLPDDELTRDWLQFVEQYRTECDAADRERLDTPSDPGKTSA